MKENEIRPKDISDEFLELTREDAITFFSNKDEFEYVDCSACDNNNSTFEFEKSGFNILDKATLGFLDIDIVKNACKEGSVDLEDRFIRHLIENTNASTQEMFQQFLRNNNLSSHMCIIVQRN